MADKKVYSIAIDGIKQSVDGVQNLGNAVNSNADNMKKLKQALKETKNEMAGLEKYSDEWNALAKVAGDYKDQIDDINQATKRWASDTKALDDALNIGKSMTSVFTLAKGAMSAFGMSTEGAVEQIQKLQGAMAILQSIQALQNTLRGSTATTDLLTKAMKACTVSMQGATTATKVFKVALTSIGIGLIIAAITELVAHWEDLTEAIGLSNKKLEESNKLFDESIGAYAKGKAELTAYITKLETFNGTKEQEKQLVEECNKKYGEAFGHYNTLAQWKDILIKKTEAYCQTLLLEAQMQAKVNQLTEAYEKVAKAKKEWNRVKEGDLTYWEQIKDFFNPGGVFSNAKEEFQDAINGANALEAEIEQLAKTIAEHNLENGLFQGGGGKTSTTKAAKEQVDQLKKIYGDWRKAELKAQSEFEKAKTNLLKEEEKRQAKLKELRKKAIDLEYEYRKAVLENQLAEAKNDEEKIKIKKQLIELDKKRQEEAAKATAAEEMGISIDELNKRLTLTEAKWMGLNETQKEVLKNLQKQLDIIKLAADTANKSLKETTPSGSTPSTDDKKEGGLQTLLNDKLTQYVLALQDTVIEGIEDAFVQMLEFEIEEAEEALNQVAELHDKQVDKVAESKDRLSQLNQELKDSSGAQLEQFKQQVADEMLLLQEREMEERRLAKEKEKREKELEKKDRQQRKTEVGFQIAQAIINTGLAVTKAFGQWGWPLGAVFGAILSALGTAQVAIMTKQYSKLADGGLLNGKSHAEGGIPVGNTGIEVEGGEYVVNKRSTAKYLPLLQQLNEEGARKKTVANQIGKMADGGQLNYEKINSNMDAMNTAKIVSAAIESIDMHPVVSVVDINRGQKNYTEVRQLAGASS